MQNGMATFGSHIQQNWRPGLTVSLVAMPLSISLAVASGLTPLHGIITAVWAGVIASVFGGSHYNVVGPTGALSGLIAAFVATSGTENIAALTIVVGVLVLAAYVFRLERFLIFIPSSVIHGFTLGVAFVIGFGQFNSAFGLSGLPRHERFFENIIESFRNIPHASISTLFVFLLFLVLLFILRWKVKKLPGALILSPFGILLGYLTTSGAIPTLHLATLGSVFGSISFRLLNPSSFVFSPSLLVTAAAIALVAILETMLSAKISDGMTHSKHDERKEMMGLGLANVVSGMVGGIPATAALARTSLNIKSGATHKTSAALSSIFLALISFFFLSTFAYIPMAVIAAILVNTAIGMVEKEHLLRLYRFQRSGFWISLLVAVITFAEDPIFGILFGTALSLVLFMEKLSRGQFELKLNSLEKGIVRDVSGERLGALEDPADVLLYSFKGKLVYINSRAHISRFETGLSQYKIIILRFRDVYFLDLDGAEALDEIISLIRKRGQRVYLTSLNEQVASFLGQVSTEYRQLREEGLIFSKSEEALRSLGVKTRDPAISVEPELPGSRISHTMHYAKP